MPEHDRSARPRAAGRFLRPLALFLALLVAVPVLAAVPAVAQPAETLRILLFTKQAGHNPAAPVAAVRALATELGLAYG